MPRRTARTSSRLDAPQSGVTVRMYNPGFGDCFLLAFRAEDGSPRYLLIDCGVHHDYPDGEQKIRLVAQDIAEATGRHLNAVAVTHEHTDHLYGFKFARDVFETIDIDDLWLAWTEDPDDPAAKRLKELYGLQVRALGAAVSRLQMAGSPRAATLQQMLNFEFPGGLGAAEGNAAQLQYLRDRSKRKLLRSEDYLSPGQPPFSLPGVSGVKFYVLGPPKDVSWIKKLESKREMYPELAALDGVDVFSIGVLAATGIEIAGADEDAIQRVHPFDRWYEIKPLDVVASPYIEFFEKHYGFTDEEGHAPAWRRIETDWLGAADLLSLSINGKTNNTSLVLAIDIGGQPEGKVLLFAADAQVGNWLSWNNVEWPGEGPDKKPLKADDLLQRTVLYKVGHHGSRNATLSTRGLEKMRSRELVALLPVDEDWARTEQHWEHPADKLYASLETRTVGRILRTDRIPEGDDPPARHEKAGVDEWQDFTGQLDWDRSPDRLWIQYTVPA